MTRFRSRAFRIAFHLFPIAALVSQSAEVRAQPQKEPLTKEQCVDAHYRGQSMRDQGKVAQARELFLKCAQSGCPALIQGDCARFADELTRMVPSVTFVARDARGADVVDTVVFLDETQVADRLDQGKSFDIDPGEHTVRFLHKGKKIEQKVVVHQGETGRIVVGTFHDLNIPDKGQAAGTSPTSQDADPADDKPKNYAPLVVMGLGGATLVTGGVLVIMGLGKVPDQCSYSSKDCAAPVGDPVYSEAKSGAELVNVGAIVGSVGLAALAGGIIWYVVGSPAAAPKKDAAAPRKDQAVTPWFDHRSGGVAWTGRF